MSSFGWLVTTFFATAAILFFTTDDLDTNAVQKYIFENIKINYDAFHFFARDLPVAVLLMICSIIFYSVTQKYLKVFHPDISSECKNFIKQARYLVHFPQVLAVIILIFTGQTVFGVQVTTVACFAAAIILFYAAYYPRGLDVQITKLLNRIYQDEEIQSNSYRSTRLYYISKNRVFGFVYRGWATLNFFMAVYLFAVSFSGPFVSDLFSVGNGMFYFTVLLWSIFISVLLFSLAGSLRSYSAEGDVRYFNAAEILNKEYMDLFHNNSKKWFSNLDDDFRVATMYSIEDDPTLSSSNISYSMNNMSANKKSLSLYSTLLTARPTSSILFSIIIYASTGSYEFAGAALFAMMTAFSFNDLVDFLSGKDAICHPNRPLPSGKSTPMLVAGLNLLFLVAFGLVILLSEEIYGSTLILLFGGIAYSIVLKRYIPVVGTPFWCALLALVITQAVGATGMVFIGVFLTILAREIMLDLRDEAADFEFNQRRNIAGAIGRNVHAVFLGLISVSSLCFAIDGREWAALFVFSVGTSIFLMMRNDFRRYGKQRAICNLSWRFHLLWPVFVLYV